VRAAYVGNFEPPHSTENHVATALEAQGVSVIRLQEQSFGWDPKKVPAKTAFVLWTHTHGYGPPKTHGRQAKFLESLARRGTPTVGYHLDRWWGLQREYQVYEEPFFQNTDLVVTADGGQGDKWALSGIEHAWFPPGVSAQECELGTPQDEYRSDIAFVGSWQGGYHTEWRHRQQLVDWLERTYGARCAFWPRRGEHAVRGQALRDLYASVKVLVGDSCLTGDAHLYCSDRIPETLGRGGFLIHPRVEGITNGEFSEGVHLAAWTLGNWGELGDTIGHYLADHETRTQIAAEGRRHVLEHHTYEVRMRQLLDLLAERDMIEAAA